MKRILFAASVALSAYAQLTVSGPSACQQAQTCVYTARGGAPPYTYSLVAGSVGSIDPTTGAYTAPPHIVPKQLINGCQGLPNNSVFNTRIDSLPVHPKNDLWMSNVDSGRGAGFGLGQRMDGSTALSTDPSVQLTFVYSPNPAGGTKFVFQPFPDTISQTGAAWTYPGLSTILDNHYMTTLRDTCQELEVYKFYATGAYDQALSANSAAGLSYSLTDQRLPGYGIDAAGLPAAPLLLRAPELLDAARGNVDAIQHAVRLTLDALSIATGQMVWPAQAFSSGFNCQGPGNGFDWTITGDGTNQVTGVLFRPWPAGTTVTVDGSDLTVVATNGPNSMTLAAVLSAGPHHMQQPGSNCLPYGTRLRLKAGFTWPHQYQVSASGLTVTAAVGEPFPFNWWNHGPTVIIDGASFTVTGGDPAGGRFITVSNPVPTGSHTLTGPAFIGCDTACQNVIQAIIRQQQRYGLIATDVGSSFQGDGSGGVISYPVFAAANNIACDVQNCLFDGLIGNASNYEIVDESSLQTSQNQTGLDPQWTEARLGNRYVVPSDAAVVQITDSASAVAKMSVSLQGVGVGVEHINEVVMAGAGPFQLHPWVTGSPNKAFTCSLTPSGGANGTITPECLYVPAAAAAVKALTSTTVTVTSAADPGVSNYVVIQIIPLSSDGKLHISTGKTLATGSPFYKDNSGIVWWNDMVQELPIALFPDDNGFYIGGSWTDFAGSSYAATAPGLFSYMMNNFNDHHFRIHVPNGLVTGSALPSSIPNGLNQSAFSFDCNGVIVNANTDYYAFAGGQFVSRPLTCEQNVTDGVLHMVVRAQGNGPSSLPGCAIPCYKPGAQNFVAGIVVGSVSPAAPAGTCQPVSGYYVVSVTPPLGSSDVASACVALDPYSMVVDLANPQQGIVRVRTHFVEAEVPTGIVDGVNQTFRLSMSPSPAASLHLFVDGVRMRVGIHYTLSGTTIRFLPGFIPRSGGSLLADYRH